MDTDTWHGHGHEDVQRADMDTCRHVDMVTCEKGVDGRADMDMDTCGHVDMVTCEEGVEGRVPTRRGRVACAAEEVAAQLFPLDHRTRDGGQRS